LGNFLLPSRTGLIVIDGTLQPQDFKTPGIVLTGPVDQAMYATFRDRLNNCPEQGLCVVELSTLGGDPEVARLMGEDVRFNSEMYPDRRIVFLGKAAIYSAGTTFMSFFARQNRYLTRGTRLMIHERLMSCSVQLNGPLTTCIAAVQAKLNELETSIAIQNEGFAELVRGSKVSLEDVVSRATSNWYVDANEAVELGLVEAVI
jgi:ATP-dependent protease ClpP protease subunit